MGDDSQKSKERPLAAEVKKRPDAADIEKLLFGEPNTPEGTTVRKYWEWLQQLGQYPKKKEEVMITLRNTVQKVFDAMRRRAEREHATQEETRQKLSALDSYLRTVGLVGQSIKLRESPYKTAEAGPKPATELMETSEVLDFQVFLNTMANLDPEDLIDTVLEDQEYISMLVSVSERQERPLTEFVPEGFHVEKKDIDFKKLVRFILGHVEEGGKEKSQNRRLVETTLWLEIVRAMDIHQKTNLVEAFLQEGIGDNQSTIDFFNACIIGGAMTKEDVSHMIEDRERYPATFGKLPKDFLNELNQAVAERHKAEQQMQPAIDRVENVYIDNAAKQYITFNKLVMGRVAELGVLTSTLNVVLSIAERIKKRSESKESLAKAFVKGMGDAVKNPWTWFGLGEIAVGMNYVLDGNLRRLLLKPGAAEREVTEKHAEKKYLRENMENHPELREYFFDHYEEYFELARRNERNEDLPPGIPKRGTFDLYPGDVQFTPEQAGKLGFATAAEGATVIHRMFDICAKSMTYQGGKIATQDQLAKFYQKEITQHQEHADESHHHHPPHSS